MKNFSGNLSINETFMKKTDRKKILKE